MGWLYLHGRASSRRAIYTGGRNECGSIGDKSIHDTGNVETSRSEYCHATERIGGNGHTTD